VKGQRLAFGGVRPTSEPNNDDGEASFRLRLNRPCEQLPKLKRNRGLTLPSCSPPSSAFVASDLKAACFLGKRPNWDYAQRYSDACSYTKVI